MVSIAVSKTAGQGSNPCARATNNDLSGTNLTSKLRKSQTL